MDVCASQECYHLVIAICDETWGAFIRIYITLKVLGLPTGNSLPPTPLTREGSHGRSLGRLSSLRTYVTFVWVSNSTLPLTLPPPDFSYHRYTWSSFK